MAAQFYQRAVTTGSQRIKNEMPTYT